MTRVLRRHGCAQVVAEVIAAAGIPVKLPNDYTPTPAVSYAVKHKERRAE